MKWLIKICFFCVLFLGTAASKGQEFYKSLNQITTGANSLNYKLTGKRHYLGTSFRGTPYLNDEWQLGSILLENGDSYDSLFLNLNTLTEELVWYNKRTGSLVDLDKFIIDEFVFDDGNGDSRLFRKIYSDNYSRDERYYNILYEGQIQLWLLHKTIVTVTSTYKDVWGNLLNSEYESKPEFFVVLPDNNVIKVKNRRRALILLFPENKRLVRRLLVRNNIGFRDISASDMAKAVELIDTEIFSN